MGSMIHLAVGRLEIDWGKNSGFADHSPLFQTTDVASVPYYYVKPGTDYLDGAGDLHCELLREYKVGLSKPLRLVTDRIELLGHTLAHCEREFLSLSRLNRFDPDRSSFQALRNALRTVDVRNMSADYGDGGEDFGKFFRREIAPRLGLGKAPEDGLDYQVSYAMENLSAYTVLRLLEENPSALDLPVTWQFADVEDGGWARRDSFVRPLDRIHRTLVVTEGSSDAAIVRRAFELLKPHIADFFEYVDMEEGYPFSGTGNLFRFVQGLISIGILNNVIVLYDNDAEGVISYNRTCELNVPPNMRILRLPDRDEFTEFETIGPNGRHQADINGQAAAIECYLGLDDTACVRWKAYNPTIDSYQGELVGKGAYARSFLEQRERVCDYDYERIEAVLDMLTQNSSQMRERALQDELDAEARNMEPEEEPECNRALVCSRPSGVKITPD